MDDMNAVVTYTGEVMKSDYALEEDFGYNFLPEFEWLASTMTAGFLRLSFA